MPSDIDPNINIFLIWRITINLGGLFKASPHYTVRILYKFTVNYARFSDRKGFEIQLFVKNVKPSQPNQFMSQNSLIGGHHRIAYSAIWYGTYRLYQMVHRLWSISNRLFDMRLISRDNKIDELWLSKLERIQLISSAKKTTNNQLGHFVNSINKTSYVFFTPKLGVLNQTCLEF